MPRIRENDDDFRVEEVLLYRPQGHGPQTLLLVEKRDLDTARVAELLAAEAGIRPGDVGFAGRKDRHAVARQWFSVPGLDPQRALEIERPGLRVLEAVRHGEKLHLGELRGNRFEIVVRGVDANAATRAEARLDELVRSGMPNRFGVQRFGRDGDNATRGAEILRHGAGRVSRRDARFLVSALQSAVFNAVLERRPWDVLWPGDLALEHRSGLVLDVPDPAAVAERLASLAISPTGPIFGTSVRRPRGRAGEIEAEALNEFGIPPNLRPPSGLRLPGDRRALRIPLRDAAARRDGDTLGLRFELPAGSYATVLVEELFPEGVEGS